MQVTSFHCVSSLEFKSESNRFWRQFLGQGLSCRSAAVSGLVSIMASSWNEESADAAWLSS
jgi:hypothetical protein